MKDRPVTPSIRSFDRRTRIQQKLTKQMEVYRDLEKTRKNEMKRYVQLY